jgi:PadR family transcriptional regulator, regulatory protein PadR
MQQMFNILRGSFPTLILLVLKERPDGLHGYAIVQEIERKVEGRFPVAQASIYPVLHSLEEEGFIDVTLDVSKRGPMRRVYKITKNGGLLLEEQKKKFLDDITFAQSVMLGAT